MRKTIISIIILATVSAAAMFAQEVDERVATRDSVVYRHAPSADSSLVGKSIFSLISEGGSRIHQSQAISSAMARHIAANPTRKLSGYRVRIFFDNSQNARNASESVVRDFASRYPGVHVYRSYQNPFFKVAVGDFRTKSEAMEFLSEIKAQYHSAFVIKEDICFPVADKENSYVTDTVSVHVFKED